MSKDELGEYDGWTEEEEDLIKGAELADECREEYIDVCMQTGKTMEEAVEMAYASDRYPVPFLEGSSSLIFHELPAYWALYDVYGGERANRMDVHEYSWKH